MADSLNGTNTSRRTALRGRYLAPVEVDGGWTSALFFVDGELIEEIGFWKTRNDALFGCRIQKEHFGCQVPS